MQVFVLTLLFRHATPKTDSELLLFLDYF